MHSLLELLFVGTQRMAAFAPIYAILFCIQIARLDLLHQQALTFIICSLLWLALCWISVHNLGWKAHVIPTALLTWITLQGVLPGLANSMRMFVAVGQERVQNAAENLAVEIPEVIECNRETAPGLVFMARNVVTGETQTRLRYSVDNGRIICWDRDGIHPRTGEDLRPVTPHIADLIAHQPTQFPVLETGVTAQREIEYRAVSKAPSTHRGYRPVIYHP